MIFDRDLIRAINSGKSFIIVGSGPSNEIGLPTWKTLSRDVINLLSNEKKQKRKQRIDLLINENKLPEVFSIIANEVGLELLVKWVGEQFVSNNKEGRIYKYLASWPFACYLTTNFDDVLEEHLQKESVAVVVRKNKRTDFYALRADTKDIIFKIHGDPSEPENIVLTQEQYHNFQSSIEREYWREKIKSVLHMLDIIIIGYSLSDPDFTDQLKFAKDLALPDRPIFMFATGFSREEITDLYEKYNIRVIPYNNFDGTHIELQKLLRRYDTFIAKRNSPYIGLDEVDADEAELASSLYLFTQLRIIDGEIPCIVSAYSITILNILNDLDSQSHLNLIDLMEELKKRTYSSSHVDPIGVEKAIDYLQNNSLISFEADNELSISGRGKSIIERGKEENRLVYEKFLQACKIFLNQNSDELSDNEIDEIILSLNSGLTNAFRKRGLEIARSVFLDIQIDPSDSTDLLEVVNQEMKRFNNNTMALFYVDLMMEVLLRPNNAMKDYLAVLSQGYFAFHALGLDKRCGEERLRTMQEKKWILDSSILIPLIAKDCNNHQYAIDLIKRAKTLGFDFISTNRLIREVSDHARWAYTNFENSKIDDSKLLFAAKGEAGFSSNLFIEGYIKWSVLNPNPSLNYYFNFIFDEDWEADFEKSVIEKLKELEIDIINIEDIENFDSEVHLYRRDEELLSIISEIRKNIGTYSNEAQCLAEAEVYVLIENENAQFLSLSTILNSVENRNVTWKPEGLYRFLSMFTSIQPKAELFYSSLSQEFSASGISIVDKNTISAFLNSSVKQSRMQLMQEKENYQQVIGESRYMELLDHFEKVSDEQKPFYSMQVAHLVATKEIKKRQKAEERVKQITKTEKLSREERLEYERLKGKKIDKERKKIRKKRAKKSRKK